MSSSSVDFNIGPSEKQDDHREAGWRQFGVILGNGSKVTTNSNHLLYAFAGSRSYRHLLPKPPNPVPPVKPFLRNLIAYITPSRIST
ncbi:hypothetical protein WG66_013590 [Moniliophthora roreri]|nr:hypothetical protein WG66_013590 [Moniliophthora roreri]